MNIYESISKIMNESIVIGKEKKNLQQGFMYRGIDDVMNTFYPLLSKYKVFLVPEVLEQTREERVTAKGGTILYSILRVKYTFYAEDGTSVSATVVGEGMDSGDKASNKAMAIAMKYAMFQVFCIPTQEMPDPDDECPPPTTKKVKVANEPKNEPTIDEKPSHYKIITDMANEANIPLASVGRYIQQWTTEHIGGEMKVNDLSDIQFEMLVLDFKAKCEAAK